MSSDNTSSSSDLVQLKATFAIVANKLRYFGTPGEELQQICEAVRHAVATNRMANDPEFAKFVYEELAIGLMQKLVKTSSIDTNYCNICADTLEAFLDLFAQELRAKRYNEQFTCAMTWCFAPDNILHKKNFQMSDDDLKKLSTSKQTWRQQLKVGDMVDVLVAGDDKDKAKGWCQARIERIEGELLSLVFPELPSDYDCDLPSWSVEIAQFESHSKEDYEWKRSMLKIDSTDVVVDCHDKIRWEESTVFNVREDDSNPDKPGVLLGFVGFRVYREEGKKMRVDEQGRKFDGWSSKYDEDIPIFCPRLYPNLTRVNRQNAQGVVIDDNDDIDEDLDDLMQPEPGHSRVFGVPRINQCISSKFISFMNRFGNAGGFDALLDTLQNQTTDDKLTLTTMGYMITMISMPSKLFHKDWLAEFAQFFTKAMQRQLLEAPDKILKDVTANDVSQIQISINSINARVLERDQAKEESEKLKLEVCKKCLSSETLERRILGIKELNMIIRNAQISYGINKPAFSLEWLVSWMSEHGVFEIIWDTKKTHSQLVQRSNEIFKLLPKENLLSMELLEQFWMLSKSDYKNEIFKIINEAAFHLKQEHIEYLFTEITKTPANKLGMEEFDALQNMGKFSRSADFTIKTSEFFWNIISDSDEHKAELIENCINKFSEMIKYQQMEKKQPYFNKLIAQLQTEKSTVPIIRLFKKIIKDQKTKVAYSSYNNTTSTTTGTTTGTGTGGTTFTTSVGTGGTVVSHGATSTPDGKIIYSRSFQGSGGQTSTAGGVGSESIYPAGTTAAANASGSGAIASDTNAGSVEEEKTNELTLQTVLNELDQNGFVQALLGNLSAYCIAAKAKLAAQPELGQEQDRTKLFLVSQKHSHQDEVNERLSFLQEFAMNSDFKISKAQLKVIYDLLTSSLIKSDFNEFLIWCNTACQAQTVSVSVLDLIEVGEFFSELINNQSLNLAVLPVVGFDFLKMYFTSCNLEQSKLVKITLPEKKKTVTTTNNWSSTSYYGSTTTYDKKDEVEVQDDDPTFKVTVEPSELVKIDMIWEIALQSQVEEVTCKSIAFLVNCYLSVHNDIEERRTEILQQLNTRCFELIKQSQSDPTKIKRLVRILESVIKISEKKGTGGVQPHNAILKGEMLDRVIIRYMVKNKHYVYGGMKLDKSIVVKLFTSATVWEFKKEVSQMLGLSPKYLKITLPNKDVMKDNQHGMTLHELNLKNGDILTAEKLSIVEEVTEVTLIDRTTRKLIPRAVEIFTEWYDMYKNPETNIMDIANVAAFIAGATKQQCNPDDNRVEGIMAKYDTDKDGKLTLENFLAFYEDAASGTALKAVHQNLKNHNVRLDLKKMSDVIEQIDYAKNEMPRHTLSANQDQFQALFSLLDRNDETTEEVWNLVRMLATNDQMYQEVLSLSTAKQADGSINWAAVFNDPSLYKQIYKQEIIVAVMEASKTQNNSKRVMFVEEQNIAANNVATKLAQQPNEEQKQEEESKVNEAQAEFERNDQLKAQWTVQFVEKNGFNFILQHFLQKQVISADATSFSEQASLKDVSFLMTLLNVFLQAGFKANLPAEADQDGDQDDSFVKLMKGQHGSQIMQSTNFEQLQDKLLQIIAQSLQKQNLILEDKIIISNAVSIIVGISMFNPTLYNKMIQIQIPSSAISNTEQLILAGLLCTEEKVRQDFSQAFLNIAQNLNTQECNPLNFLLSLQARNFASISNRPSRQFFELFNELIDLKATRDSLAGDAASNSVAIYDPEDLLNQIIDKIKAQKKIQGAEQQVQEETEEDEVKALELANEQERLLVGLITLTGKIIAKADKAVSDRIIQEKDLIGQIFKEFLFVSYYQAQAENSKSDAIMINQQKGSRNDKKKTCAPNNKSREAAYELLHQLIKNSTALMKTFLDEQLTPLIQTIKKPKSWSYVPPQVSTERNQKYVGLRNLGCICYMNSMMQQFFMIPAFRYNLLCIDDGKPLDMKLYKGEQIDDNMMHQCQNLIAHLELSERSEFDPKAFCFAFKEFDGSPTNTAEQKDAQEFLNVIFDRLENALKETSRKHLVNGIFGGKLCSQMVCTECGKFKNRMEDYLNLSLPVKGVKSIEESLQKQIEGEIINDYQCDGCNRKVDLQKRTMIASTPNILIVHLQRICFNFDTFQNDKVNSFCSFPNVLDLKPYSFHEVMGKENRLKEQQEEEEVGISNQIKQNEEELTEEELAKKKEAEEEAKEPDRDDCYEYKLVGVNVHSGTANAGHYWSYINTNRGIDETEGDSNWIKTEADLWMEYNDSRVSDWEFKELKQRTFGNEVKANQHAYLNQLGDSYGTSGYMLFYERRKKKDLKIVVPAAEVEERKAKGEEVCYDEKAEEHYQMVNYRKAADGEKANEIYKKVFEDNMKFTFESDIYSTEFFDFILQILQSVADSPVDNNTKVNGLKIGKKVGFDILARMMANPGIDRVSRVMIDILKSRPEITRPFIESMCDTENSEVLWEVLLECPDKNAQKHLARVIMYALCQLKMEERDSAMAQEVISVTRSFTDTDGVLQTLQEQVPKAICIRFVTIMTSLLAVRAPKNWRKFESFLEIFYAFMVFSAADVEANLETVNLESDEFKTGVELYFKYNMIRYLGDFILQENSPYNEPGQVRTTMGGAYGSPNFGWLLKTIILMISDKELSAKYPLDENNQAIVSHKDILAKMIEPGEGSTTDFSDVLVGMAFDNVKISKKMAKAYLKGVSKTVLDSLVNSLKQIRKFLQINDSLKSSRLEWIFGIPQVLSKPNYKTRQQQYGLEIVETVSDEYIQFKSGCVKGVTDAFLGQLYKAKHRQDNLCLAGLKILIDIMLEDEVVARYIFNQPAPSLQYARYTDWFFIYVEQLRATTIKQVENTTNLLEYHKKRLEALDEIMALKEQFESKLAPWIEEQKTRMSKIGEEEFIGFASHSLHSKVSEVIPSFPPTYIVGPTILGDSGRVILTKDNELATVYIEEVTCEFMYSNPTGQFNLTVPDKMWRNPQNYQQMGYQSWKIAQLKAAAAQQSEGGAATEQQQFTSEDILTKNWLTEKSRASTILKVMIKSKATRMVRVGLKLTVADNERKNVNFPMTEVKDNLFSNEAKQTFVFLKVDPSKDSWGDIDCEVNVKLGKTTQISSTGYTSGGYSTTGTVAGGYYAGVGTTTYNSGGYMADGVTGMSTQTESYKPSGYDEGSTEVSCVNCEGMCYAGEDYCRHCGKSVTEYEGDGI